MIDFTDDQLLRYSRQILLNDIGIEGQAKIIQGKVLIIGSGGLGSPNSLYLTAAGVGELTIIDHDVVELGNLQRQIVHHTSNLDQPKVLSAKAKLNDLNPEVTINAVQAKFGPDNAESLIAAHDVVIDATDNFLTKFLINDTCIKLNTPLVVGGLFRYSGQLMTVIPGESACYRCMYPEIPDQSSLPRCADSGILASVAGMLGTMQATEALKLLTQKGTPLTNQLLTFDAQHMDFHKIRFKQREGCVGCGS